MTRQGLPPWHSHALAAAAQKAQTDLDRMSPQERDQTERTAERLASTVEEDRQ
ncbi:hypothetical protein ACIA5D_46150 [Actinoplanes sp. NPDC051513]|uniref:hypothetical protein n=1 Tax=Actinoplanes sp. NPDC051513 TaxID=3363908 RepID=UPI0037A3848E